MASFAQLAEPAHTSAALMSAQDADKQHGRFTWPGSAKWTDPELWAGGKAEVAESNKRGYRNHSACKAQFAVQESRTETSRNVSARRPSTDGSVPAVQGGSAPRVVEV